MSHNTLSGLFLRHYDKRDIRIRKKVRAFLPIILTIAVLSVVLSVLMALTAAFTVALMIGGLAVFCVAVLWLLYRGRYTTASSVFLYGLFLVMLAAIKFDEYQTVYETYVFAALGLFLMVIVGLIGASSIQAWIVTILNLAGIIILYALDTLGPIDNGEITLLAIQSLATCFIITIAAGSMCASTIRMQQTLLNESESASRAALEQYEKMSLAIEAAWQDSEQLSARLLDSAQEVATAVRQMKRCAEEEKTALETMERTLESNAASEDLVIGAQSKVKKILSDYSRQLAESGETISAILHAVRETGTAADQKREAIHNLSELSRNGADQVAAVVHAITGIVQVSEGMEELNTLIGDVAGRTNLLGMNASIEAAHAGDAGRGFGVVAEEIRTLSEETAQGSRNIGTMLAETRDLVRDAVSASEDTSTFFARLSTEISDLAKVFGELLNRLKEITEGTSAAFEAIGSFTGLAESAGSAADESARALAEAALRSAESRELARRLIEEAREIGQVCETLTERAEGVRGLGEQNLTQMGTLKETIAAMRAG